MHHTPSFVLLVSLVVGLQLSNSRFYLNDNNIVFNIKKFRLNKKLLTEKRFLFKKMFKINGKKLE